MEQMLQLEKRVLGTILANPYLLTDCELQSSFFQTSAHQTIFRTMLLLSQGQKPIDFATILTCVEPREVGGANYVADLTTYANPVKFDAYVDILRENWLSREKHRVLIQAKDEDWTIDEIQQTFDQLVQQHLPHTSFSVRPDLIQMAERPFHPARPTDHVYTNIEDVDQLLDGFKPAELVIIAARPSMGKTDVLNHFALQAGLNGEIPIIFSLEMSKESMIDRLIASVGAYNRLKMRDPYVHFTDGQKDKWLRHLQQVDAATIQIDDRSMLTVEQMRAAIRKIMSQYPHQKPAIFIDYLQIIHSTTAHRMRNEMIGEISSRLKQIAKDFHCPVICLSQLNRAVESRDNKRPVLSDLRDSGNIEQDADVIGFLYRDNYYDPNSAIQHVLELHIAKNRNGPIGRLAMHYTKETGVIRNLSVAEKEAIYHDYSA